MNLDQMCENQEKYLEILSSVERDGIEELCNYLKTTDFFTAPASTSYHLAEAGGLCKHSINVYENMIKLRDIFCPDMPDDTIKVTSLLHDLAKIDFYTTEVRNKKVYSENGSKSDETHLRPERFRRDHRPLRKGNGFPGACQRADPSGTR